jgi:hypothetical protein
MDTRTLYAIGHNSLLRLVVHGRIHNLTAFQIQLDGMTDPLSHSSAYALAYHHDVELLQLALEEG